MDHHHALRMLALREPGLFPGRLDPGRDDDWVCDALGVDR
jgi:hypothetical protein